MQSQGQNPDETPGQESADPVDQPDQEGQEPSQGTENLPDKPPPEENLPDTGEPVDDSEPEPVPDHEFMAPEQAADDPTVDDAEQEEQPHNDLPEGTRAQDYENEQADGTEETPPAERGQRGG
jgi:hypothetical protein